MGLSSKLASGSLKSVHWHTPDSTFEQPCHRRRLQAALARILKHSQALRLAFAGRSSPARQVLLQLGVLGNSVSGDLVPPLSLLSRGLIRHVDLNFKRRQEPGIPRWR